MRTRFLKLLASLLTVVLVFNGLGIFEHKIHADADRTAVSAFVERGYINILEREADESGLNFWTSKIVSGQLNASEFVANFIESNEFTSRHYSNERITETIYRVMLSREADNSGKAYWSAFMNDGLSPRFVINGFADSAEFRTLCASYGISTGHASYKESRDINVKTTRFVTRMYRHAFGNNADTEGLNYWTGRLNNKRSYADDLVASLVNSSTLSAEISTDSGFIGALYRVCFGGTIDDAGRTYWLNRLARSNRTAIIKEFTRSNEFRSVVSSFGLTLAPTATPTPTAIQGRLVALTFDDGPYAPVTNRILDQLEAVGGHATFFVVGNRVNTYSSCVIRANALGCEIGNHTYDHRASLTSMSASQVQSEIAGCNEAVHNLLGFNPVVMRPVGGAYNDTVASNVGMPMIIWSVDTNDWRNRNASSVANAILNNVHDGDIVLMHDLYPSTAAAMEIVIPELVRRGYTLVTVSELARSRGVNLGAGVAYRSL